MRFKHVLFQILILLVTIGCAPSIYISSELDPSYKISKTDKIAIFLKKDSSIGERKFLALLRNELQKAGFNIVDRDQSEYVLVFALDQNTSKIQRSRPVSTTSETKGTVGGIGGVSYKEKTTSTKYVPYSYDYTVKKLYLHLFAEEDISNHKLITIWEGYLGAGEATYAKYTNACVRKLLEYFGTDYKAHTQISTNYR